MTVHVERLELAKAHRRERIWRRVAQWIHEAAGGESE